ncbi:MAG: alpha/beta hydrolase [Planctomycetaceae bacterium]
MKHELMRLGELECYLMWPAGAPRRGIVLCHGFGAPGTDLVPLGEELGAQLPELARETLFVFPEAPLAPREFRPFGGRAWWPLDMERLQSAMQAGSIRDLRGDCPERLPTAREELGSVLAVLERTYDLPVERLVIGGFSQGAMLATETVLRLPTSPAGLVIYSGTLLNEPEWRDLAPHRSGLQVLQSHGTEDSILPFTGAEWLRDLLTEAGLNVEFQSFRGGHTITAPALEATGRLVSQVAVT